MKKLSGSRKVYNLEVRDLHNFLVGDCGVVVHNNYGIVKAIVDAVKNIGKKYNYKLGDLTTMGNCDKKAKAIRDYLRSKGVKNPISIRKKLVDSNGNVVSGNIGWDVLDSDGNVISSHIVSNNGFHEYTLINGKVYDNISFNGIDLKEFEKRLVPDLAQGFKFSDPIYITD